MSTFQISRLILICFSCIVMSAEVASARTWTDSTGQYKFSAEIVGIENGVAHLKAANGNIVKVPLAKLAASDQTYARKWWEAQQKKGTQPAPAAGTATAASGKPDKFSWPCFHGADGSNISPDTGLARSWPEGGPQLLMTVTGIGDGYSSVSISDGVIYTAGNKDGKTMVFAISSAGKIIWSAPNGPAWTKSYPGTRGTPTIDGAFLYHKSPSGNLICLNRRDGSKVWEVDVMKTFSGSNITWGLAESVLIDGNNLICTPGGSGPAMVALNKQTGKPVWKSKSLGQKPNYASPVLITQGGLRILLSFSQFGLFGVNADTGDLLFTHEHKTAHDINATNAIYHEGQIFITSGYGTTGSQMLKLETRGKMARVSVAWKSKDLDNKHGGIVLYKGYLYGSSDSFSRGEFVCLDWKTGRKMFSQSVVGKKGCCTLADGLLYMFGERKNVALAAASPQGLKVTGEFKLPSGGSGISWAHPVVLDGKLYLRYSDRLYIYNVK